MMNEILNKMIILWSHTSPPDNKFLFLIQSQVSAVFCADFECISTSLLFLPELVLQVFTGLGPDKGSYPECFLSCVCCSQVIEHCCYLRSWNNWMSVFTCFRCMFAYILFQVLTSVFWVNLIMLCDVSLRGIRRNYCTCQRISSRGSTVNNRGSLDLIHIDSRGTKYLVRAEKSVCSSMLITKWQSFHRLARGGYLMKETAVS